jgi:dolichyl-diphosphooligosaccharide--protein glycosyltransferase
MFLLFNRTNAKYFGVLYCIFTYYFSQKMVRLILLLAPAASMASGFAIYIMIQWAYNQLKPSEEKEKKVSSINPVIAKVVAVVLIVGIIYTLSQYYQHSEMIAEHLSEPQIILRSRKQDGSYVIIDDFRLAYWWLRDNTPADSRVMAWWDYGYQINGIANRTTIADGNTWNHEHIALLGKCLVSKEEDAWRIARHLADYVLVWSTRWVGMIGDDAAKMPHMANIAGSVFPEINQRGYYIDRNNNASPLAKESLLYKLIFNGMVPGVEPLRYYDEVYTSPHRMVRIYKIKNVAARPPKGKYPAHLMKDGKIGQFKDVKN